jgi:hypothetical protein
LSLEFFGVMNNVTDRVVEVIGTVGGVNHAAYYSFSGPVPPRMNTDLVRITRKSSVRMCG